MSRSVDQISAGGESGATGSVRLSLIRWTGWFAAVNSALFGLVGLRYLFYYQFPLDLAGYVYVILAFIGHFTALASIPLFLVLTPLAAVFPRRRFIMPVGVMISSFGLSLLLLDTNVFAEHRFHLSRLTIELFDGSTWLFSAVIFLILLIFQAMLAGIVWRSFVVRRKSAQGYRLAAILVLCWLIGQGMHIWGDAVAHTPVTQFTRFMPLYYPIHAKRDLARLGLVDPEEVRKRRTLRQSIAGAVGQLRYPLSPMDCPSGSQESPNLLIVLIDALRPDVIDPELTRNINAFRESGISFVNHYSGGNSSRMGIFSLFYGLPSTYFQSFYDLQQPPVLMDQIRNAGYELALFSAVGFGSPSLTERTSFAGLPELMDESKGSNETSRNRAVTDGWLKWLSQRNDQKPFFNFLYFDPPMGDMPEFGDRPLPMDGRFGSGENVKARWHQYRMALAMVDEEFGKVMNALRQHELLDSTIVIVVSDHGYEFDDNGLGYVGHASNFSPAQLHSTLLMHWPGREAVKYRHRSSHHDLPVTLLQDVFRCVNPPTDYSVGRNLFSGESWQWIMAGSYSAHAIVQPEQVIVSHPGGFVETLDQDYRPDSAADFDAALIQESMAVQRRFFR